MLFSTDRWQVHCRCMRGQQRQQADHAQMYKRCQGPRHARARKAFSVRAEEPAEAQIILVQGGVSRPKSPSSLLSTPLAAAALPHHCVQHLNQNQHHLSVALSSSASSPCLLAGAAAARAMHSKPTGTWLTMPASYWVVHFKPTDTWSKMPASYWVVHSKPTGTWLEMLASYWVVHSKPTDTWLTMPASYWVVHFKPTDTWLEMLASYWVVHSKPTDTWLKCQHRTGWCFSNPPALGWRCQHRTGWCVPNPPALGWRCSHRTGCHQAAVA